MQSNGEGMWRQRCVHREMPKRVLGESDLVTTRDLLHLVADTAADFVESLATRAPAASATVVDLRSRIERPLLDEPVPVERVITDLVRDIDGGLVASGGPRYFGFVIGGATPASLAADWMTSAWDQNAQVYATSPAAAIVEDVVAAWLLNLLGLPPEASVGFVTGCQMANFTALCVARNAVLARAGWDIENRGLFGAPPVTVIMSEEGHATVKNALRMLGIGSSSTVLLGGDAEGRVRLDELESSLKATNGRPVIISAQAGNVNSGAFEPIGGMVDVAGPYNAWVHVDGAFGLWAAVSPRLRSLVAGVERADSWATDAHKWLNVPYDSGIVAVRRPELHRSLKSARCDYAGEECDGARDGSVWVPENSRRARAFVLYAVLRTLGQSGVRAMIERCCDLARQFAAEAARLPFARVVNEVVLNQVLIRFDPPNLSDVDSFHEALARELQRDGACWIGTTRWQGQTVLRLSIANWSTDAKAVSESVQSVRAALERCRASAVARPR